MTWSIEDVSAEKLAKLCHHYREALAHNQEQTASEEKSSWEDMPYHERKLMVAATRLALLELATVSDRTPRPYFATPGEAEWGC